MSIIGVFVSGILKYCCHVVANFREACATVFNIVHDYLRNALDKIGGALGIVANTIRQKGSTLFGYLPSSVQKGLRSGWAVVHTSLAQASDWMYRQVVYVCKTTWSMFDCAIRYNVRTPEFMSKMCIFGFNTTHELDKPWGSKHGQTKTFSKGYRPTLRFELRYSFILFTTIFYPSTIATVHAHKQTATGATPKFGRHQSCGAS